MQHEPATAARDEAAAPGDVGAFRDHFVELFDARFDRIFRYLDRLTGDAELAADLAQEAFVRLYRRGAMPDSPDAWLFSVAMNLFRNARTTGARRRRLVAGRRPFWHGDPPASPARAVEADAERGRVRAALDRLSERDRALLLLRAEGYPYRDLAEILDLNEASVGTLLARARDRFRDAYGGTSDA